MAAATFGKCSAAKARPFSHPRNELDGTSAKAASFPTVITPRAIAFSTRAFSRFWSNGGAASVVVAIGAATVSGIGSGPFSGVGKLSPAHLVNASRSASSAPCHAAFRRFRPGASSVPSLVSRVRTSRIDIPAISASDGQPGRLPARSAAFA